MCVFVCTVPFFHSPAPSFIHVPAGVGVCVCASLQFCLSAFKEAVNDLI